MEYLVIGLFCMILMGCVFTNTSTIIALLIGYIIFYSYGIYRKYDAKELLNASFHSFLKVKNILITFILIGSMTALWRASGTIATFVYYAGNIISPSIFIMLTFILNSIISFITGTSVGTASTMGVICMSIALSMDMDPLWIAGAILSGSFFGDRCSPVSTSAMLVATVTDTDLYQNIKYMLKSCILPFILSCIIYFIAGLFVKHGSYATNLFDLFQQEYIISWICLIPAIIILVLALLKVSVKINLSISIIASLIICLFLQHIPLIDIIRMMFVGYHTTSNELATMMNGGGIQSMVKVGIIISVASSYSGLFEVSHLLDQFKNMIISLVKKLPEFLVIIIVGTLTAMIGCNQTLAIMLTRELCQSIMDQQKLAIAIENSVIVIAGMIPWSVACITPIAAIGSSTACIFYAVFLYMIPITYLITNQYFFTQNLKQ